MSWKPFTSSITSLEIEAPVNDWPVAIIHIGTHWNTSDYAMAIVLHHVVLD